ncbi:hypothetical protein V9T40_007362 [Parthenolecanium corni]|uniref:Uncharacterized protein n=1 Tax=Parthenolecanium corni TaxID=536013 RepID=A0AAN9U3I0_9HEMI
MDEVGNGYPVCGAGACATLWWCGGARSKNVNHDDRLGAQTVATSRRAPGINYPDRKQKSSSSSSSRSIDDKSETLVLLRHDGIQCGEYHFVYAECVFPLPTLAEASLSLCPGSGPGPEYHFARIVETIRHLRCQFQSNATSDLVHIVHTVVPMHFCALPPLKREGVVF